MPIVRNLILPFFTWKAQAGSGFKTSSKTKYEPHLDALADWSGERDVADLSTQLLEFEFLPGWVESFVGRHGRTPARNTIRLLHNALSSFFDYCDRRGLVPLNPMRGIARPSYVAPMNDWLSYEEDLAMATVAMRPLEDIVCGLARLAGLRVEEIAGLLIGHVDRSGGFVHVFGSKTESSVRSVVLFPELEAKLDSWLAWQAAGGFTDERLPLVSTRSGTRIHESYIWRIVKRVAARAGVRLHGRNAQGKPVAIDLSGENVSAVTPADIRLGSPEPPGADRGRLEAAWACRHAHHREGVRQAAPLDPAQGGAEHRQWLPVLRPRPAAAAAAHVGGWPSPARHPPMGVAGRAKAVGRLRMMLSV
jgi:site-specific recombinase XerC